MKIDGKKIAEKVLKKLEGEVKSRDLKLRLVTVLVGSHAGSKKFLQLKGDAAKSIGVDCKMHEFDEKISTAKLREELHLISKASVNSGILLELPLPDHLNTQYILNSIPIEKDVDVLAQKSQGAFFIGRSKINPPAVEAVRMIFEEHDIEPKGLNVVTFGYGLLVGKPLSHWLGSKGATVTIVNEFTKNPEFFSQQADLIISGVGKADLIKSDMVKEGAVVIDFGFNKVDGKIKGDVDYEPVSEKASLITPVPGGVGPLVVAAVLNNLIALVE